LVSRANLRVILKVLLILTIFAGFSGGAYLTLAFNFPKEVKIETPKYASPPKPVQIDQVTASAEEVEPTISVEIASAKVAPPPPPPNPNIYLGSSRGMDISYPQCGKSLPALTSFAIIGLTDGKSFTQNPCFSDEWHWAKTGRIVPSFYMNLNFPSGSTASRAMSGPAGNCLGSDMLCQGYNYGYNAAADAKSFADAAWIRSPVWWLDIEIFNTWSTDAAANSQVIQGSLDYLSRRGIKVGIYSTPKMWWQITENSYNPRLPVWVAGLPGIDQVTSFCADQSFGGGPVWLVQYTNGYDYNYSCN
jgi:hypothetical protein